MRLCEQSSSPCSSVKRRFCSQQCYFISCRVTTQCLTCGKTITSQLRSPRSYCSHKCSSLAIKKHHLIEYRCPCGVNFKRWSYRPNPTYCSKRCFVRFRASSINESWVETLISRRVEWKCLICGKPGRLTEYMAQKKKACSAICAAEYRRRQIINGDGFKGLNAQRRSAREYYGNKCMECGYSKIPEILQVHHRDRNTHNGSLRNLLLLCPNCHEEHHYRDNSGRFDRLPRRNREKKSTYRYQRGRGAQDSSTPNAVFT